jgi:hypothetical protein
LTRFSSQVCGESFALYGEKRKEGGVDVVHYAPDFCKTKSVKSASNSNEPCENYTHQRDENTVVDVSHNRGNAFAIVTIPAHDGRPKDLYQGNSA